MIHYLTSCTFGAVLAILLRAEQKSPWQWLYPHRQHSTENDEDLPYYLLMFFFQLKLNSQVKKKKVRSTTFWDLLELAAIRGGSEEERGKERKVC